MTDWGGGGGAGPFSGRSWTCQNRPGRAARTPVLNFNQSEKLGCSGSGGSGRRVPVAGSGPRAPRGVPPASALLRLQTRPQAALLSGPQVHSFPCPPLCTKGPGGAQRTGGAVPTGTLTCGPARLQRALSSPGPTLVPPRTLPGPGPSLHSDPRTRHGPTKGPAFFTPLPASRPIAWWVAPSPSPCEHLRS